MSFKKIVVDTDIFVEHLTYAPSSGTRQTLLRKAMSHFFCYTTVFNAVELFSLCRTDKEVEAVENSMQAMKILGLNAKSAKRIGPLLASAKGQNRKEFSALIAGLCIESRLPLVTRRPKRYRGMAKLELVPISQITASH